MEEQYTLENSFSRILITFLRVHQSHCTSYLSISYLSQLESGWFNLLVWSQVSWLYFWIVLLLFTRAKFFPSFFLVKSHCSYLFFSLLYYCPLGSYIPFCLTFRWNLKFFICSWQLMSVFSRVTPSF